MLRRAATCTRLHRLVARHTARERFLPGRALAAMAGSDLVHLQMDPAEELVHTSGAKQGMLQVLIEVQQSTGIITLNRPKALNSLNTGMVTALHTQYRAWATEPAVACIIIRGSGGKAFCAGGDVKGVVQGSPDAGVSFFREEYAMNHALGLLQKPHVALMDGIVMGGGAGISIHGQFRVATEKTLFAMPECAIGLFPDVGASFFLPRLPGHLGAFLALTGSRLRGAEVVQAGLATHLVPSSKLPELQSALAGLGSRAGEASAVAETIASHQETSTSQQAQQEGVLQHVAAIDECFRHESVEEIYAALQARGDDWAHSTLKTLKGGSPLSQKLALREVREGARKDLASCLCTEFRLAAHILRQKSDFSAGVTALLIDKSGPAKWQPPTLEEVSAQRVDSFFAPLQGDAELELLPLQQQSQQQAAKL